LYGFESTVTVADTEGPPNSWPSEEKLWELLSSWLSVSMLVSRATTNRSN